MNRRTKKELIQIFKKLRESHAWSKDETGELAIIRERQRRACAARNARARERKTKATKHTKASFLQGLAFLLGRFFR